MTSKFSTEEIEPEEKHLQDARPLLEEEFDEVVEEGIENVDLSVEERKFYDRVLSLSQDMENDIQYQNALVSRIDGELKIVSGYRRYLACKLTGMDLECKIVDRDRDDIPKLIYSENVTRDDLTPYNRAKVLARMMGLWDYENDEFLPPSEADQEYTLSQVAKKFGTSPSTIYKQLSPVRRNGYMQEDFGDEITESSLRLIEEIAPTEAPQYDIAQSLVKSTFSTHKEFKELVDDCKEAPGNTVENVCKALIDYTSDDSGHNIDELKTSAQLVHERNKEKIRQEDQETPEERRERMGRIVEKYSQENSVEERAKKKEIGISVDDFGEQELVRSYAQNHLDSYETEVVLDVNMETDRKHKLKMDLVSMVGSKVEVTEAKVIYSQSQKWRKGLSQVFENGISGCDYLSLYHFFHYEVIAEEYLEDMRHFLRRMGLNIQYKAIHVDVDGNQLVFNEVGSTERKLNDYINEEGRSVLTQKVEPKGISR